MSDQAIVFVNLGANDGRAAERWKNIQKEVADRLPGKSRVVTFFPPGNVSAEISNALTEGVRTFISAGGDGSAHHVLNQIMVETGEETRNIWLGGIGLGSSNDFIKPKTHFIHDIPTRLEKDSAILADVGKARWLDEQGRYQTRYFIANASMGVTAEANRRFNAGDPVIHFLKKRWTLGAIIYTAVRTILQFRNFQVTLVLDDEIIKTNVANIALLKSPFVSGNFLFDDPVQRDDGMLGVNICVDMSKTELLATLSGLSQGKFKGRPKTISKPGKKISITTEKPVALEMDGEIVVTREVTFSVLPKAIHLFGL